MSPRAPGRFQLADTMSDAPTTEHAPGDPGGKVIRLDPTRMVGRILGGRFRVDGLIAQGAMGRVFLATQLPLARPVALKLMNRTGDPRFATRFFREASIAARLAHPNVVSVYDYGETERGELFMVMELCAGRPLHQVLFEEAPLPPARALGIAMQIARALRKAHAAGVVHRDLKPANIMIDRDEDGADFVKVLDFGLVKPFALDGQVIEAISTDRLTLPGNLVGTPEYVSPEQALGEALDGRADLYSLGVILFQMITGRLPFKGSSMLETVAQHFKAPIPWIEDVAPGVRCPPDVEQIIRRALEKSRDQRFGSAEELLRVMESARARIGAEAAAGLCAPDAPALGAGPLPAGYESASTLIPEVSPTRPRAHAELAPLAGAEDLDDELRDTLPLPRAGVLDEDELLERDTLPLPPGPRASKLPAGKRRYELTEEIRGPRERALQAGLRSWSEPRRQALRAAPGPLEVAGIEPAPILARGVVAAAGDVPAARVAREPALVLARGGWIVEVAVVLLAIAVGFAVFAWSGDPPARAPAPVMIPAPVPDPVLRPAARPAALPRVPAAEAPAFKSNPY